jgi:hypothetical protein
MEMPLADAGQLTPASIQIPAGAGIAISPRALTKPTRKQKPLVKEKLIRARKGGRITILSGQTQDGFEVPRKALKKDTRISMEVIGEGPSTVVRFGPSGLQFLKTCTLSITFPKDGVDPKSLGGYVVKENGKTTPVPYTVKVHGKWITVRISVPHFSVYEGDDDVVDDPPPDHDWP